MGGGDAGKDTSFSDGCVAKELVQFLVVSDGQEDVSGHNSGLLVVLGGISGKFENLGSEILKDGGEVDGGTSADSFSVMGMSEESSNPTDRELKTSPGRLGDSL